MNIGKTKEFYRNFQKQDLCDCAYCRNYIHEVKPAYPELSEYLERLGVDIEKPLETMPLEPDGSGYIEYAGPQYIVCGKPDDFVKTAIGSVYVDLAGSHPSTGMEAPHFVIELYPIRLKWVMGPGRENRNLRQESNVWS